MAEPAEDILGKVLYARTPVEGQSKDSLAILRDPTATEGLLADAFRAEESSNPNWADAIGGLIRGLARQVNGAVITVYAVEKTLGGAKGEVVAKFQTWLGTSESNALVGTLQRCGALDMEERWTV